MATSTTLLVDIPMEILRPSQEEKTDALVEEEKKEVQTAPKEHDKNTAVFHPDHTVSYQDINDILKHSYNFEESITATSLDILALYLKGQKTIYTEAKTLCEKRLNTLMLPAIFIAAVCSILNFILKDFMYGTIIISSLNAFNSFLLSLISYLKLDAKAEAHKTSAYKFQKLEASCEFSSGKAMFFKNSVPLLDFVKQIEKEVMEIRESNQFILPEVIRLRYSTICSTNVFSLVKQVQNDEILVTNELKIAVQLLHTDIDKRNAIEKELQQTMIRYENLLDEERHLKVEKVQTPPEDVKAQEIIALRLKQCQDELHTRTEQRDRCRQQLDKLKESIRLKDLKKNEAFKDTVDHRKRYLRLNNAFKDEIEGVETRKNESCFSICNWFKT